MKLGIDNYSYHRYFNEVYPGQNPPPEDWDITNFVDHILSLSYLDLVEGLSIETCFLSESKEIIIAELSRLNIPLIFQWGHPNGFMDLSIEEVVSQLSTVFEISQQFKCDTIRIVVSGINFVNQPHQPQIDLAIRYLEKIIPIAKSFGIKLALENHCDLYLSEIQSIVEEFNTPYLGVTLDTGNLIRLDEDPLEAISIFKEKVYLMHAKDVAIIPGFSPDDPLRYGCVPAGSGCIDFTRIFQALQNISYRGMILIEISSMHPDYKHMGEIEMIHKGLQYLHSIKSEGR